MPDYSLHSQTELLSVWDACDRELEFLENKLAAGDKDATERAIELLAQIAHIQQEMKRRAAESVS